MALPASGYDLATVANPGSALTDFTVIVDLSTMSADWWSAVDTSDGTKGRAAIDATPTEVATDWINFDDTGETGVLRVKWAGTLAASGTQKLRIYPPMAANDSYLVDDPYGSDNAYDDNWKLYWPLGGGADRTQYDNDGTANGGVVVGDTAGQIGYGTDFDRGSAQSVSVADNPTLDVTTAVTVVLWCQMDAVAAFQGALSHSSGADGWTLRRRGTSDDMSARTSDVEIRCGSMSASVWKQYVWTFDTTNGHLLSENNGVATDTDADTTAIDAADDPFYAGFQDVTNVNWDGRIQEVQLHDAARPGDWLTHEYDQTSNNADFWVEWIWQAGGSPAITLTATTPEVVLELPTAQLIPGGVTLTATTLEIVLDVPTAALALANVLAANTVEIVLELPTAVLIPGGVALVATTPELVLEVPSASLVIDAPIVLTASTPEIVLDVPSASLALASTLTATTPEIVLDVPAASLGLATTLTAGTVELVLSLPTPTLVTPLTLTATTPELVLDIPAATLVVSGAFTATDTFNDHAASTSLDGLTMSDTVNTWALGLGAGFSSTPADATAGQTISDSASPCIEYCDSMAASTTTQTATITLKSVAGRAGVVVRYDPATNYRYQAYKRNSDSKVLVARVDSGGSATLITTSTTWADDDTLGLKALDTGILQVYKNGVQDGVDYDDSAADDDVLTGRCGIYSDASAANRLDLFVISVPAVVSDITLTATTPEIVLDIPAASLALATALTATTPGLVLDIPSATLAAANALAAGTPEIVLDIPGATLVAPVVLSASTVEIVLRAPSAVLAGVNQTLTASVLTIVMAVPSASLSAAVLEYRIILDVVGGDPLLNVASLNTRLEMMDADPLLNVTNKEA